ncbi:hypothetical protein [Streptomyces sp. SID13031]|uniref:hypothetical protein n=1 Tax=Streptomyces sp. SID13031 TaxID=2706046 RepID=UPI0013C7A305|nr:hypothetical protein [Streptomyces sp. SID13031]NEA36603.1 hypothetical protein [Streptomyces sp. SID13031]
MPRRSWLEEAAYERHTKHLKDVRIILPWRRPCTVRVLLVTDGGLNFGEGDFGLSTFVGVLLNDQRSYVRFDLTLAHLRTNATDSEVMAGAPGITRSIKGFAFDNPDHFDPNDFDEVWLFGIETFFHSSSYANRLNNTAAYPVDRLGHAELAKLTEHMNRGGGLFATGDHGSLGRGLGGSVDRARNMRHWQSFAGPTGQDEVSMGGVRRNDSNVIGHDAGSQFSDQSDDIPQQIDLKLYSAWVHILRAARYPHPVLCSRYGRIDVFPDHPHEGECRTPDNLALAATDGTPEYPDAADGSGQVVPEIVAWGRVPAGNDGYIGGSPTKLPTQAHRFPLLSTYDGHRARVGRVVCDSTWHHFVNVNLIGILEGGGFDDFATPGTHPSKHIGFLYSAAGKAALAKIREYYVNVAVWIATPERLSCMRWRSWWDVIWDARIVEATLDDPNRSLDRISIVDLYHIGIHARDVLGKAAGQCQSLEWLFPVFDRLWPEIKPWIDPWPPHLDRPEDPPLPWFSPEPLVAVALGGAVVALRAQFPYPDEAAFDRGDDAIEGAVMEGAEFAIRQAREQLRGELQLVERLLGG